MSASLWQIEDDRLRLAFHPGQAAAWQSERRFIAMIAGSQGGKTSFGPWWLNREIQRRGPGDYLAVSSSFDLFKLRMLPAMRETFEHLLRIGRYWAGDRVMELADPTTRQFLAARVDSPMWGRIILRSAAAGSGLESASAKAAWLDEAGQDEFTVETWEAVLRRLALAQGRVLVTTTPYSLDWLKRELYDRWTAGDPSIQVIQFSSTANPAFPAAEFERARRTMPGWRFRMFYEGQFSRPAGLIYEALDELHVVDPIALPASWPRYAGVDFGGANTALIWLAHDPDANTYHLYDESLCGGRSSAEHAQGARNLAAGTNLAGVWGGAPSEEQQRTDFTLGGFQVRQPPVEDVEGGIDRVTQLLKERRLYVFRSCKGILDEFATYRRKLDAAGQPTEEIENKRAYHRLDALRYAACGLIGTGHWIPVSPMAPVFEPVALW